MRTFIFPLILFFSFTVQAQSLNEFLDYLEGISDPGQRQVAVDSFINTLPSVPFFEDDTTANFLYNSSASDVKVVGDFNFWNPSNGYQMSNFIDTDLWYYSHNFESDARLDYKLVINGSNWILDPLNPNTVPGGFGPNSELAMPAYEQPWEIQENPDVPKGTVEVMNFESDFLGGTYQVQIYLPPSYTTATQRSYPTIYVQDGQEYLNLANAATILDNLIFENSVSEMIGVFIRPNDRNAEYAFEKRVDYQKFIVHELTPHMDSNYRTLASPENRAAIGTSYGGNISALIAYNYPEIFGKCGLHSPAFQPNNYEMSDLLTEGEYKDIQIGTAWGTYEGSLTDNLFTVVDALEDKGYHFQSAHYPEGHSWGLWRATLDDLLTFLFPPGLVNIWEEPDKESNFLILHPNPVVNQIGFTISDTNYEVAALRLINSKGRVLKEYQIADQRGSLELPAGLSSGLYYVQAIVDGQAYPTQAVLKIE